MSYSTSLAQESFQRPEKLNIVEKEDSSTGSPGSPVPSSDEDESHLIKAKCPFQFVQDLEPIFDEKKFEKMKADRDLSEERLLQQPLAKALEEDIPSIMREDRLNRHQNKNPDTSSMVLAERLFSQYVGTKYTLGVSTGGLAIQMALRAIHLARFGGIDKREIAVYSNSFTFGAVPSAIQLAGFTTKLVECGEHMTLDLDNLQEQLLSDASKSKYKGRILMLSYIRGRVPDMDRVLAMCQEYDMILVEDSAHCYGCKWKGKQIGAFGLCSTISMQANKLVNSGEGGAVMTDDPELHAIFMAMAGCYEQMYKTYDMDADVVREFEKWKLYVENLSCRMTQVQGAMVHRQVEIIRERVESFRLNYRFLQGRVAKKLHELQAQGYVFSGQLEMVGQLEDAFQVYDSLQVRVRNKDNLVADQEHANFDKFVTSLKSKNASYQKFTTSDNARFAPAWLFLNNDKEFETMKLEKTLRNLYNVVDVRLKCVDTTAGLMKLADDLVDSFMEYYCTPESI
jgi:dTDP-4-amino-4,6-dideoxygalactose transaminase